MLAETSGPDLQILWELCGDFVREEQTDFAPVFGDRLFRFLMTEIISLLPTVPAKIWAHKYEPPSLGIPFMPGSLPEAAP